MSGLRPILLSPFCPKMFDFTLLANDPTHPARTGVFQTPHGPIETPVFAPVGTQATVKTVTPRDLHDVGASLILANTYHLFLRPGADLIADFGGLHGFMAWPGPILTDSGGYQVFSLALMRKIDPDGVTFRSHIDGSLHRLTPEISIAVQESLGADIIMCFDECPEPHDRAYNEAALQRTHAWAVRCKAAKKRNDQALFGIVQGGIFPDLRIESARALCELDFPGYAVGGLSVGETKAEMYSILDQVVPELPADRPRYLMGVGVPEDIVEGVRAVLISSTACCPPASHATAACSPARDASTCATRVTAPTRSPSNPAVTVTPVNTSAAPICATCSKPVKSSACIWRPSTICVSCSGYWPRFVPTSKRARSARSAMSSFSNTRSPTRKCATRSAQRADNAPHDSSTSAPLTAPASAASFWPSPSSEALHECAHPGLPASPSSP